MTKMNVITNLIALDSFKEADKHQIYIYVIENSEGKIKIGKTTNPANRINSLSGSNTGGASIVRVAVMEEPTYILTLEDTLHNHYNYQRIPNTEWFEGLIFDEVITYINGLLQSKQFDTCTKVRKDLLIRRGLLSPYTLFDYDPYE